MASKPIGLGSLVKCDFDGDGTTHETVGLTRDLTPPGRAYNLVEAVALEDTLEVAELGIEERSEFSFAQFWKPGDTAHEKIDTLFDDKDEVEWQIVYPLATPITDEFLGKVSAISPEQITPKGTITRTVTVQRTSAITRT